MNAKQANNLATICTRYSELHVASNNASDAILNARGKIFGGLISEEEFDTLSEAMEILWKISNQTTQYEAVKYFMEIEALQKP
jgi:hypothetical protein